MGRYYDEYEFHWYDLFLATMILLAIITTLMTAVTACIPERYRYTCLGEITKYKEDYAYIDPETHKVTEWETYIEYNDEHGNHQIFTTDYPKATLKPHLIKLSNYKYAYKNYVLLDPVIWLFSLLAVGMLFLLPGMPIFIELEPSLSRLFDYFQHKQLAWLNRFFGKTNK